MSARISVSRNCPSASKIDAPSSTATMPTCIGVSGASIARLVKSTALSRSNPMVTETSWNPSGGPWRSFRAVLLKGGPRTYSHA